MTDEETAVPPIPAKRSVAMDDGDRRAGVASYDDPADGKQRGRVKEVEEEAPKEEKKAAPKKAAAKKKAPAKKRTAAKKK